MKIDEKELKTLFNELRKNNKEAFEKLYLNYNKLVYGIAFSILKDKDYSEDIVQTVFMKLYSMDKYKLPVCMEASWLYTLTKNETISYIRNKKSNVSLEDIYELESNNDDVEKIMSKEAYNKIISKLNEKEKEIVSLKVLSSLTFEEIGKVLNIKTSTVKWKYYNSVNRLKILIGNIGLFVVTFVIGIGTLFKEKSSNNKINNSPSKEEENLPSSKDEIFKNDVESIKNEILENDNIEEIIVKSNEVNYIGVSFLCISSVFLIIIITFLINFVKYQLKSKEKTSK